MNNYCLYHANCPDGFASAFAVWKKYGDEGWKYLPVNYQEPVPLLKEPIDKIFIVDFSYPLSVLKEFEEMCQSLVVIDHHESAKFLIDYRNACFSMDNSGCVLTWRYLFSEESVPELLYYVEDRDLWRWKLPNSREINLGLSTIPKDFTSYSVFLNNINELYLTGCVLTDYKNKLIEGMCGSVFKVDMFGYRNVPCLNCTAEHSETAEYIYSSQDVPFVILFQIINDSQIKFSLRTNKEDVFVNELVRRYGGGEHPKAAGFTLPISRFSDLIMGLL